MAGLRRQFIADGGLGRDGPLYSRPRHHPRVMRVEIRKLARRGLQRFEEPPIEAEQVDVGDRITLTEDPAAAEPMFGDGIDLTRAIKTPQPCRMQGRGDERHPGYRLCLGLDVVC